MGIADMDFRAAPSITKALMERMQHENWGYLDMSGPAMKSFTDGIVSWNKRRYGVDINPDSLVITTGVHPGLIAALKTFSPPGSKVLLQTPTYNGFYSDLTASGTDAEENPLKLVNGRYSMDFEDFERRISHDTNTLILCNPQNPTGNCWSTEDLTAARRNLPAAPRRRPRRRDPLRLRHQGQQVHAVRQHRRTRTIVNNSITFKAASKSFGLAAMKCAWFFSDNADYVARVKANNRADLTTLGMIASKAAYAGGEDWLNAVHRVHRRQPRLRRAVRQGQHPDDQGASSRRARTSSWLDVSAVAEKINAKQLAAEANKSIEGGRRSRCRPSRWSSAISSRTRRCT